MISTSVRQSRAFFVSINRFCHQRPEPSVNGDGFVPFGSKNIRKEEKTEKVTELFSTVAKKYDMMNDLMSAGVHRCWKNHLVESRLTPSPKMNVLDVGGGTGDVAMRIVEFMRHQTTIVEGSVTVLDPTEPMMAIGKERGAAAGMSKALKWVKGIGEQMPFDDNTFDAITMAFSIRNCADANKAIEESFRVLKPGGRFFCLEFFKVDMFPVSKLYDLYLDFLPVTGFVVTGKWNEYQYLSDSIRRFNTQDQLMSHMRKQGFHSVLCEKMPPFGVACILSGKKPEAHE